MFFTGIRHALIDRFRNRHNVDLDEAVFMLRSLQKASFSSYLARKHQRQVS